MGSPLDPCYNLMYDIVMYRIIRMSTVVVSVSLFIFFLSGCAGLGKRLEAPRINVSNIQLKGVKALESVFQIELRIFNTNDIPIVIKGMACDLEINDRRFASGVSNKETAIPSYGTEIISVIVYSSVLDIFKGVLGLQNTEKLKYGIKGKVRVNAGSLAPSVIPFKSEGELSFDRVIGE